MSSGAAPGLFTRKATGLVREARTSDALFYNVMWASVALSFAFAWLLYGFSYLGSNMIVSFFIAAALGLPGAFVYAMLSQIMPRTGGDYVFNSRSLHPSVGFAANFSFCVWLALIYGLYTTYMTTYGFGAFGRMMAGFTGSGGWLSFGDWFSHDYALFITGTVAVLVSAALFIKGGLRLFLRLQVFTFAIYILRHVPHPGAGRPVPEPDRLPLAIQRLRGQPGDKPRQHRARGVGEEGRLRPTGFHTTITLKSVSVFWYVFGFLYASNYFAGEIRLRKRTHLLSIPGALLRVGDLLRAAAAGVPARHRLHLQRAARVRDPSDYGFVAGAPAYPEIMGIASGSWVLGAVIIIGFTVGLFIWLPQTMLLISRSMFAWSFDRIMPDDCHRSTPGPTHRCSRSRS